MFRMASVRSIVGAPTPQAVASVLDAHATRKLRSRLLGATAEVLCAAGAAPAELARRVTEAARAGEAVSDVLEWEGGEYLLHLEEAGEGRTAVEVYALRAAPGAPKPPALVALLYGDHAAEGEGFAWLDAASEARLAPRLASVGVSSAYSADVSRALQAPELRKGLAELRASPVVCVQPRRELDVLEFEGLARKQFVLACTKGGDAPLFTLDSEEKLQLLLSAQARCPRCDEPLGAANVRLRYSVSDVGAEAADQPLWLLFPLLSSLQSEGVRVRPLPASRAGARIGGIAYCGGLVVALHAYDRDVVPADAVHLAEACLEIEPDRIVVLTTGQATPEAKRRLTELASSGKPGEARVQFFEGRASDLGEPFRAWWQALADERLRRLLSTRAMAGLRRLGLSPAALAEAALRQSQVAREVSVSVPESQAPRPSGGGRSAKAVKA